MIAALDYLWLLFEKWIGLFTAPARNFELLWLIIPIYLNWIFTEFYQEKKGTSLGNAISNGFVPLWVGIDWSKTTYTMLQSKTISLNSLFWTKMGFSGLMIAYGLSIVILGIRVKKVTHYIGRIRVVTYFALMLTPIYYGATLLDWNAIIAVIVFFPLFYYFVELIDRKLPNPKTYDEDEMPQRPVNQPAIFPGEMPQRHLNQQPILPRNPNNRFIPPKRL
ncbi:MAG: hypothetical protein V1837_02295 [Candidatus Woesearchaeota archaeon]